MKAVQFVLWIIQIKGIVFYKRNAIDIHFKAINIGLLYVSICNYMTMFNVTEVRHSVKLTDKYHPTLQFPSARWSLLASFSLVF